MSSWKRAIEAACEAVKACKRRGVMPRLFDNAIAAIRAIPEPPEVTEENIVQQVATTAYLAWVFGTCPPPPVGDWKPDRRWYEVASEVLSVVRERDNAEVRRLREGLEALMPLVEIEDPSPWPNDVIRHLLAGRRWDGSNP